MKEESAVRKTPRAIMLRRPQCSCQRPTRNMNVPTAASIKNIVRPVAARPTENISCHKGAITPGKPNVNAPGQKMAMQVPMTAIRAWLFFGKRSPKE